MPWGCCWALLWLCAGLGIIQGEAVQGHFQPGCLEGILKRGILVAVHHERSSGMFGLSGHGAVCPPQPRLFMAGLGLCSEQSPGASAP